MNTSRLGKAAEKRAREECAANGYTIQTSALSRGPADFLAGKPGQVLAVQVKRTVRSGGGVSPAEWNQLLRFAYQFGALPVVAIASPRQPVTFYRLIGPKTGRGRQPWVAFTLDRVGDAA